VRQANTHYYEYQEAGGITVTGKVICNKHKVMMPTV